MDKSIIPHVFASLLNIERQLQSVTSVPQQSDAREREASAQLHAEQRKVVAHMRRIANHLQLLVASNDISGAVRALRVYYGLNHMIRPELFGNRAAVTEKTDPMKRPLRAAVQPALVH